MTTKLGRHEEVRLQLFVYVYAAVLDAHAISGFCDHALHKRLVGVPGVIEHHDVPGLWHPEESIGRLVDDQTILVLERWLHTLALDPSHLDAEGDDERGVDRGRRKRLEPREQLLTRAGEELGTLCGAFLLELARRAKQIGVRIRGRVVA